MHWFYEPDLSDGQSGFSAEQSVHAKALRIRVGEQIAITNGLGKVAFATVAAENPVRFEIHELSVADMPSPRFHLVQALAKNDRDELALQSSVELGCRTVTPWQAARSIVKWDQKAERNQSRWQAIAIEAMKQSQQSFLCEVKPLVSTKGITVSGVGIILDPRGEAPLSSVDPAADYTIIVGPEGGISEDELLLLKSAGFRSYRMGPSVLRASTAGPAAIAAISALHGSFRI